MRPGGAQIQDWAFLICGGGLAHLRARKYVSWKWEQFKTRREPDDDRARGGQPEVRPQWMARGPLASKLRELRIFFRRQHQIIVVMLENRGDALFFLGRIKRPRGHVFHKDGFFVELPRHQVAIPDAEEPGPFPSHKAVGN